jgi:hypothetical protein
MCQTSDLTSAQTQFKTTISQNLVRTSAVKTTRGPLSSKSWKKSQNQVVGMREITSVDRCDRQDCGEHPCQILHDWHLRSQQPRLSHLTGCQTRKSCTSSSSTYSQPRIDRITQPGRIITILVAELPQHDDTHVRTLQV